MTISGELERAKIDLVEYHQPLSERMEIIQQAILEVIDACLSELKRSNYFAGFDADELTVDRVLFRSFDYQLRQHLDPHWHRLSSKTKHLVSNFKILRRLLHSLIQQDCVSFYRFLEMAVTGDVLVKPGSSADVAPWLIMPAAETIFKVAKERVFRYDATHRNAVAVLEENPKWQLLKDIVVEIEAERQAHPSQDCPFPISEGPILIMVSSEATARHLKIYLSEPDKPSDFLRKEWNRFRSWDSQFKNTVKRLQDIDKTETPQTDPPLSNNTSTTTSNTSNNAEQGARKRLRRARGGGNVVVQSKHAQGTARVAHLHSMRLDEFVAPELDGSSTNQTGVEDNAAGDRILRFRSPLSNTDVVIAKYDTDLPIFDSELLDDLMPRFIVIYDPNSSFVRQVEMYKAKYPGLPLRVYFLVYANSVEEQKYLTTIKQEKEAFESLIRTKSIMAVQKEQDGKTVLDKSKFDVITKLANINTRVAGGSSLLQNPQLKNSEERPIIIVDMREFRSQLPCILYTRGFQIKPATLEVGDYVLAPDVVVERKSLTDLISSLNSGRLYNQCEAMTLHYKNIFLLIEFEPTKAFTLQAAGEGGAESSIASRLVLLTIHFPHLRILWSSSPFATVELFQDLKSSRPEPDVETAVRIGVDQLLQTDESAVTSGYEWTYNYVPVDILQRLVGPTSFRNLTRHVKNLQDLCRLEETDLAALLNNKEKARSLYRFLHQVF